MGVPFTRLASQVLDAQNLKLHDQLKRKDGVIAVLGARERITMVEGGGTNFSERLLYGQNTNIGFRGKNAEIPTADDEGLTRALVPQKTISGSIVINRVELSQVQGRWALGNLFSDKKKQANTSWVQVWADTLRQAIPGANDPYTLLPSGTSGTINGILSPAAYASQAGSTAGISRADNTWWRNGYTNTAIDISSEGGDALLFQLLYDPITYGAGLDEEPDFGLTNSKAFGDLGASASTKRRGSLTDQQITKLGFRNIMYYNAAIIRDSSTRFSGKIALLNTRSLAIKVLREAGMKAVDQDNALGSVPVVVDPFQQDINSLNKVSLMHVTAGLVPMSLREQGLADNVT